MVKPIRVPQTTPLRRSITMLKMILWMELKLYEREEEEAFGNGILLWMDAFWIWVTKWVWLVIVGFMGCCISCWD